MADPYNSPAIPAATPHLTDAMVTTAMELPGMRVTRSLGLVRGITVRSRSVVGCGGWTTWQSRTSWRFSRGCARGIPSIRRWGRAARPARSWRCAGSPQQLTRHSNYGLSDIGCSALRHPGNAIAAWLNAHSIPEKEAATRLGKLGSR